MHAQRHPRHDAESTAASALQRPEQVGVGAGIGDANLAVGSHDLGLEETRCCEAVMLGEASEAAALNETGEPYGCATTALNVLAGLRRHSVIGLHAECAGADGDGRLRLPHLF